MKLATPSYIPLNKKVGLAPTFFFIPLPFLIYSVELVFIYPNYTIIHIVLIIHIGFLDNSKSQGWVFDTRK